MPIITEEVLARGQSAAGGWTRAQLTALGVAWPPASGWKARVIGMEISQNDLKLFLDPARHPNGAEAKHRPYASDKTSTVSQPSELTGRELNALRAVVNPAYRPLRWPTRAEEAAYLKGRREENLARSVKNPNENWMANRLSELRCSGTWRRQRPWGYRIFDFFDSSRGVAIEVDGREHDSRYDSYRDVHNFLRSGIVVLRVRNRNDDDARSAVDAANRLCPWRTRRRRLGVTLVHRKHLVVLWRDGHLNGIQLLADTIATGTVPDSFAQCICSRESKA